MSHKDQSKVPKEEEKNNKTECSLNSETRYVFVTLIQGNLEEGIESFGNGISSDNYIAAVIVNSI